MAGYDCVPMKMKRKEIDRVNDDFSDFSLSSPAKKIRRLDLDLPPIKEEEVVMEEHVSPPPENEERAIVLFKPPTPHHHQPHLFVDRSLISGLKNRFLHDVAEADEDYKTNKQQAVVPWNPSHFQFLESTGTVQEPTKPEIVELDGDDVMMEEADMDVEEKENSSITTSTSVSLHQWQQPQQQQQLHHCMIPQLPQTNSTPISWFR
ncbi:unnamed protein product [Eruca vesicaria subsp. sativa]|uniref:Uncharacterized protein n=1 Tax=Eruca vesicaria subsp. sativa TaxID=29727 RepID=A0ABC8KZ42_ERUVS|nr:unnamed protein product [Eruca vesicaria subsp. sativa]